MMANASDTTLRMARGRTALLFDHPFFGALILRLKLVEADWLDTMATDGASLFFNARFVAGLSDPELVGVLAHEVMHPALQHHTRRGDRDAELWNVACDYAINPILLQAGMKLPTDCLNDPKFANMAAEEIYAAIARQTRRIPARMIRAPIRRTAGMMNSIQAPEPGGQRLREQHRQHREGLGKSLTLPIQRTRLVPLRRHKRRCRPRSGGSPSNKRSGRPRLPGRSPQDWNGSSKSSGAPKSTGAKPFVAFSHRRYRRITGGLRRTDALLRSIYLPSLYREGLGEIAVAIDTSGSITDDLLAAFAGELSAIAGEARPERIHVIYCDASSAWTNSPTANPSN